MQTKAIHASLKEIMRSKGKTYAEAAEVLELSEGSVKRLFSSGSLSLHRLETLCNWIGTDIKEVVLNAERQQSFVTHLSLEQEQELVENPRLILVTFLVLNNWKEHEIKTAFDYTEPELNKHFAKLERLGLIELLQFNQMRLLTARNFKWSENGPVRAFFAQKILPQFIQGGFTKPGEKMHFMGGMLSEKSILKVHEKLEEFSRCFDELLHDDLNLPANKRYPVAMMMGIGIFLFANILGVGYKIPPEELYNLDALK